MPRGPQPEIVVLTAGREVSVNRYGRLLETATQWLSRFLGSGCLLAGMIAWQEVHALQSDEIFASGFGATATFYVAPNGEDTWSGTLPAPNGANTDGPFATFDHARAVVQALDKTGIERVFVIFRDGTYPLTAAVAFTAADSGTPTTEIVYRNYPGESPAISGGVRIKGWTNAGGNVWQVTLSPSIQYFENLFYNGARRLRPRLGGYLGTYNRIWRTAYLSALDPADNNCPSTDGYECFDRFDYNPVYDPTDPTSLDPDVWGNLVPAAGSLCPGQTPGPVALQGDIEVLVFEQFSTSKLRVSCVDTVNHRVYMTGPTAVPGAGNASEAGFIQGNRIVIENVRGALTQPGQWFLDRSVSPMMLTYLANPGEDPNADIVVIPQAPQLVSASGLQYVTMRGLIFQYDNYVVPFNGHVSTELEPDTTSALSFQNSQNIKLDGIEVRRTAGGGVDFMPCLVQQVSSDNAASPTWCAAYPPSELVATTATASSTIVNSAFFDLGVGGIRIGENSNAILGAVFDDGNSPNGFLVDNNVVAGYGRVIPASFGIGQGVGHGNMYTHNDVYDGYHCAISISHAGGDNATVNGVGNANNTISFNHVHDLLQGIMNDGGSIRIEAGNSVATSPGNTIFNNIVHDTTDASALDDNGYGGNGIYMDNSTGLVDVENNLVYRVSGYAIYSPHGPQHSKPVATWGFGQSNLIKNNILAFANKGMFAINDPYKTQNGPSFTAHPVFLASNNLVYFDRDELSTPSFDVVGGCTYAAAGTVAGPFDTFQSYASNLYWRTDGAFATVPNAFPVQTTPSANGPCTGNSSFYTNYYFDNPPQPSWVVNVGEDAGSVIQDPGFANPHYPADNYSLTAPAPVGFVPFDLNAPGRQNAAFNPPTVDPTFTIAPLDPATGF